MGIKSVFCASILVFTIGNEVSGKTWSENSRIKKMDMFLIDKKVAAINLLDSFEIQSVAIPLVMFLPNTSTRLKFVIVEVYPGEKYKGTVLSLLMFSGVGVH